MNPTDDTTDDDSRFSRRRILGATATVGALGLAGCSGNNGDGTPTDTEMDTTTETMGTDTPMGEDESMAAPDVPLLNYALTLEHLENAFYREGLETFSDDELMNADALSEFTGSVRMEVPDYLRTVGAHEAAHVTAITDTVEQLGGTPVEEGEYDFGYQTPS